jgi:hypothetical protein
MEDNTKYIAECNAKIDKLYEPPHTVDADGIKHFMSLSTSMTIETLSIKFFAEAVGYNKQIMDIILDDRSHQHRNEIIKMGFPYLAIKAKGR